MTQGTLYIVATPIGNLADMSPRAREVLATVDLIAAEDTRHTRRLLDHFGIATRQQALHEHNEQELVPRLIEKLQSGHSIALVSDAGTPLISDPGFRLVSSARRSGIDVSPIPGPSAVIAALSAAGLPTDRFCFEGFLPAKKQARRSRITGLVAETRSIVLYESVHRISECIADLCSILGVERLAFVGREISKQHEQCVGATLGDLQDMLRDGRIPAKGEFVVAISGAEPGEGQHSEAEVRRLLRKLMTALPGQKAASLTAEILDRRPNDVYRLMLEEKKRAGD